MMQTRYPLNLQFFSAESEGRTEKATGKKRSDARKKGQVAKSNELATAALIISFCAVMKVLGSYMMLNIKKQMIGGFNQIADILHTGNGNNLYIILKDSLISIVVICVPLWICLGIVSFLINYWQVGYKVTFEPMKVKFSKMNPISGLKRIISKDMVMNLVVSLGKVTILGMVVYKMIKAKIPIFISFYDMSIEQIFKLFCSSVLQLGFYVGGAFIVIAILDYIYQKFKFEDSIKMTKQEVKDEFRNSEGDPQVKGKIRQKMREGSLRRMMQAVPEADVIITNPTHFAVAIKYDESKNQAPIVVAKGVDYLAQKIKEKAKEHQVEIVENVPLARALYYTVDLNQEIPPELYGAVAEVLAFVYNLGKKKNNR